MSDALWIFLQCWNGEYVNTRRVLVYENACTKILDTFDY